MATTVEIISVQKKVSGFSAAILVTIDGVQYERTFDGLSSRAQLENSVRNWIKIINSVEDAVVTPGVIELPVVNDVVDTELEEYRKQRAKLRQAMDLVRDGVYTGSEPMLTDLQALVKSLFKPRFLDSGA